MQPWVSFQVTYADGTDFDWDDFDVDWFCDVPSADVAKQRLDFLSTAGNIYKLRDHGYAGPALDRMWKAILRKCISYAIPLTPTQIHIGQELGIVVP